MRTMEKSPSGAKAPAVIVELMYGLKPVPFTLKSVPFTLKPVPFTLKPVPFTLRPYPFSIASLAEAWG
ncbi:MAG: hypothetical protein WA802_09515 [Terracidiphilus sp.]